MKKILTLTLMLAVLCGCASLNTVAFRAEKLTADTAKSSTHLFNEYYKGATNGASPAKVTELNNTRDQIYDADRKLAAVLAVTEAARLQYATNPTPATEVALRSSLSALGDNRSNLTNTVANALAPYSTVPGPSTFNK